MTVAAERVPLDVVPFGIYRPLRQEELPERLDVPSAQLLEIEQAFIESGFGTDPDMTVDTAIIGQGNIEADRTKLIDFRDRLGDLISPGQQAGSEILQAYSDRVDHDINITELVLAAIRKDWPVFRRRNEQVYGPVGQAIDLGVKAQFIFEAVQARENLRFGVPVEQRPNITGEARVAALAAAERVHEILGAETGKRHYIVPPKSVFKATKQQSEAKGGYVDQLFKGVDVPAGIVTEKNGDLLVARMLTNMGSNAKLRAGTRWAFYSETNELERPKHYELPGQEFKEYQAHEFLHMVETMIALRGLFLLATTGLAHYSLGNEGSAIIPEQILNPTFKAFAKERRWHMILARHLAVSLGRGYDRRIAPMSSSELYAILKDVFFVYESQRDDAGSLEEISKLAHEQAFELLACVKAGTDGSRESGVLSWPLPYARGNRRAWAHEKGNPGAYYNESVGKIDITSRNHHSTMVAVGALVI